MLTFPALLLVFARHPRSPTWTMLGLACDRPEARAMAALARRCAPGVQVATSAVWCGRVVGEA